MARTFLVLTCLGRRTFYLLAKKYMGHYLNYQTTVGFRVWERIVNISSPLVAQTSALHIFQTVRKNNKPCHRRVAVNIRTTTHVLSDRPCQTATVWGGGLWGRGDHPSPQKCCLYLQGQAARPHDLVHMSNVSNVCVKCVLRKFFLKPALVLHADLDRWKNQK